MLNCGRVLNGNQAHRTRIDGESMAQVEIEGRREPRELDPVSRLRHPTENSERCRPSGEPIRKAFVRPFLHLFALRAISSLPEEVMTASTPLSLSVNKASSRASRTLTGAQFSPCRSHFSPAPAAPQVRPTHETAWASALLLADKARAFSKPLARAGTCHAPA